MYVFGGKDVENNKMNDLWRLDLDFDKWEEMEPVGVKPMERSGHSADFYNGNMIIFGGLFEITKELNDCHLYDFESNRWIPFFEESGAFSPKNAGSPNSLKTKKGMKGGDNVRESIGGNGTPDQSLTKQQTTALNQSTNPTKKPTVEIKTKTQPRSPTEA